MNALQLFRSQVSQKETLCQNSFERRAHLDEKQLYRSFSPLGLGLWSTHAVHLRFIGKRMVYFQLVIINLFFARCYGWGCAGAPTSENRLQIGVSLQQGQLGPKFRVEGVTLTKYSCLKTTMINLFYGIKWYGCLFYFVKIYAFHGQADGWTDE